MQVCNQQEFDLFNQKCRHSSLSMGQEMKRIDSSSLKNEKTFQMSILKVDTPFIMLWYLKCNAEIKTNYLINHHSNWSLKGAMKFPLNELQWATITSIFLMTQFDWLKIEILFFSWKICLIFSWSVALKCSHYYIPHRACHSIFYQIELSHR